MRYLRMIAFCLSVHLMVFVAAIRVGAWTPYDSDWRAFLTGGRMVLRGQGAELGSLEAQTRVQQEAFPELEPENLLVFMHPPWLAAILAPFSALGTPWGAFAWDALVSIAFAVVLVRLQEELAGDRERSAALILTLTFTPAIMTILQGQLAAFITLALIGAWQALRRGDETRAGLWLGLVLVKPHLLLVPAVALLASRRFRSLVALGGCGVAALLLALATVGTAGLKGWVTLLSVVSRWEGKATVASWRFPCLRGVASLVVPPGSPLSRPLWMTASALVVLSIAVFAARRSSREGRGLDRLFALVPFGLVLSAPQLYFYDTLELSLTSLILWRARGEGRLGRALAVFPFALYVVLIAFVVFAARTVTAPLVGVFLIPFFVATAVASLSSGEPSGCSPSGGAPS